MYDNVRSNDMKNRDLSYVPENMRIVSKPVLKAGSPLGGLGVVGREGMGVVEREPMPFSFVSLPSNETLSLNVHQLILMTHS